MKRNQIEIRLEKIEDRLRELEKLCKMIISNQDDKIKTENTALLDEYLFGARGNED